MARSRSGNMLVFSTAVTIGIVAILAFFSLSYVRLLGSNSEQRNAIEAASLAAARDLSMIAINTPDYGFVSLSDSAPTGDTTTAADAYNTPVRSINTIIGTLRLDMIIADQMKDANLKTIISADLVKAKAAQALLATELTNSLAKGYSAKDINGSPVDVYGDAEAAYKANQIRMTGSSNYVANSLKLSLGAITNGGVTNTPLPNPSGLADVPAGKSQNDFYLSYVNVPTAGQDFVFAGVGDSIKLIDPKQWVASVAGLPYQLPTVVKAEADQHVSDAQNSNGYNIHAVACAQPANVADPKPAPGALSFSFPDGIPPEIKNPLSLLTNAQLNNGNNCSFQTSKDGDYPIGKPKAKIVDMTWPYNSLDQSTGNVTRVALVDWWRRAGTKLNVSSAANMFDASFTFTPPAADVLWKTHSSPTGTTVYELGNIPAGNIHIYRIDPSTGQVSYQTKSLTPFNYSVAGEDQMFSENTDALVSSVQKDKVVGPFEFPDTGYILDTVTLKKVYDVYVRDQVYQPGSTNGGRHAGEPMDWLPAAVSQIPSKNFGPKRDLGGAGIGASHGGPNKNNPGLPPSITSQSDFAETSTFPPSYYYQYSQGPGSGANPKMRPTYQKNGMAADIRFRRQVNTGTLAKSLGYDTGYVGEKLDAATISTPALPPVTVPPDPSTDTGTGSGTSSGTGSGTSSGTGSGTSSGTGSGTTSGTDTSTGSGTATGG
ncbi:hypothetical protein BH11CYA1_BH11CYA1_26480 [soil metagenome]